jgi:hypothetical protein
MQAMQMQAMQRLVMIPLLLLVWMAAWSVLGQDQEEKEDPSVWMKQKLEYSKNILAGVATADFELVVGNATRMKNFGALEKAVRGRDPAYLAQLKMFEFANQELIRTAKEENVDGAALAFTQLTLSCVNCHKYLRDPKRATAAQVRNR